MGHALQKKSVFEAKAEEMTVNEKLCKNISLKLQATYMYVLDIC